MKAQKFAALGCVIGCVLLSACSTPPKAAPVTSASPAPAPSAPAPSASATPTQTPTAVPAYLDPASPVSRQRSVYFSFDDSTIRQQDRPVVEVQGRYLSTHPDVKVRVEGNTDERGSAEYNLALGQRRAESMARALRVYGVRDAQMEVTSWGAEKPVAQGHDEAAWAQNRRADVVYPSR